MVADPDKVTAESGAQDTPPVSPDASQDAAAAAAGTDTSDAGGDKGTFDPESVSKEIDKLTEDMQSNDVEVARAATDRLSEIQADLERRESAGDQPEPSSSGPSDGSQPEPEKKPDNKGNGKGDGEVPTFGINYKGERIEREDKNRLLGFENTGKLKAAYLKETLLRNDERTRFNEEKADLQRKLDEATVKLKSGPAASQPPTPSSATPPSVPPRTPPARPPEKPVFPQPPQLSTDDPVDYTEEDKRRVADFTRKNSEAQQKMVKYMDYLESKPGSVPEEVSRELTELRQFKSEAQQTLEKINQDETAREQENAHKAHWGRFSSFQSQHKSFETPMPLQDLHKPMLAFMRNLATANGLQAPSGEIDYNNQEHLDYLERRAEIVEKFLGGDEQVASNAEGLKPPEGYDRYFKLLEIENARRKYINDGVFGEAATLEDAYDRMLRDTGDLEKRVEEIQVQARTKGAQDMGDALDEASRSAANIPPEASAAAPDYTQAGVTKEDLAWLNGVGPTQYQKMVTDANHGNARAKDSLTRYNSLVAKLEAAR